MLWMNLLVFTKQPYSQDKFHDLKICPYDQEGFIAALLIMPKSSRSELKKGQHLHSLSNLKALFLVCIWGIEDVLNCL